MKNLWYILGAIAAVYILGSLITNQWNPFKWAATPAVVNIPGTPPAEGSACALQGRAGTIVNGTCVPTEEVVRISDTWYRVGRRRVKCYSKPAATSCVYRRFEPSLGWGTLYSQTPTSCCYIF